MSIKRTAAVSNLPVDVTSFFGRERALSDLHALLPVVRLLTLTGSGGSGKTRLALELVKGCIAADVAADIVWIELAALQDPALIPQRVAEGCGVRDELRGTTADALATVLRDRSLLIVLDNCEHVVDACATLVDTLVRECPRIRVLATSREALGVRGERAWLVPPLATPRAEAPPGEILQSEACQLFVERAQDFGKFEITQKNAAAIGEICRRLDGIPLAIELAASRVRVLSPEQLLERLDNAFALLKSSNRTAPPRHRTLAAAIEWSYDLLEPAEQMLFRRLAVFRGGFTLEAVEAACAVDPLDPSDVLDVLEGLVSRSLVSVHERNGIARYALLEVIRQYAATRLTESGEEEAARLRHMRWVASMVATAEPHFIMSDRPRWIDGLLLELDNIRAALAASRLADPPLHVRLAGALWWFWFSTRHWTEAGRALTDALSLPEAHTPSIEHAKLQFATGALAALQSNMSDARARLGEAVTLADDVGHTQLAMYARTYLAMTYAGEARTEGDAFAELAAEWFANDGDLYGLRLAFLMRAHISATRGELNDARRYSEEAVDVARRFGQPRELSIALQTLSFVNIVSGDVEEAEKAASESIAHLLPDPSYFFLSASLDALAEVRGHQQRWLDMARLFGAADRARALIGAARFAVHGKRHAPLIEAARAAVGNAAFDATHAAGHALLPEQIIDEVLAGLSFETPAPDDTRPTVAFAVRALGPLFVEVDGRLIRPDEWAYAKPKELLLWLLLHPQGGTRKRIAPVLWPGASPTQLKNSFHVTMHHLRRTLGRSDLIVVDGERYRIAIGVEYTFDADDFAREADALLRDASASTDVTRIANLLDSYRGDLMGDDTAVDWIDEFADPLRRRHTALCLALGAAFESAGDTESAVSAYMRVVRADDLNEEAHRRLMSCWLSAGDRPRALRQYERLKTLLRDAIDADPEPATTQLFDRIRTAQPVK